MASFLLYYPTKAGATTTWTADQNPHGASSHEKIPSGTMRVTAGGAALGQVLSATTREIRRYVWTVMAGSNYDDLEDFFVTTCKGGAKSFQYDDEDGTTRKGRFLQSSMVRKRVGGTSLATATLLDVQIVIWDEGAV